MKKKKMMMIMKHCDLIGIFVLLLMKTVDARYGSFVKGIGVKGSLENWLVHKKRHHSRARWGT